MKGTPEEQIQVGIEALPLWEIRKMARRENPTTSHLAAESMQGEAGVQRQAILQHLKDCVYQGHCADDLDQHLALRPTSCGRRLKELELQGLVWRTGETRQTRSGRAAEVWALTEKGRSL